MQLTSFFSERISIDEVLHAFIQAHHPRRIFQATLCMDCHCYANKSRADFADAALGGGSLKVGVVTNNFARNCLGP